MNNFSIYYLHINKILRFVWITWIVCFSIFVIFGLTDVASDRFPPMSDLYPDSKFYKLKVLRNKIARMLIIGPVKKVEFDLAMADNIIYASKLMMEKGKNDLAAETALKGENYYSMLVQDYNISLITQNKIPDLLDRKITQSAIMHQKIFKDLENASDEKNKETFRIVTKFSIINYDFIVGLRNPK